MSIINYIAASYLNLSDGDRKIKLLSAEKLLISFLSYGWNNFETYESGLLAMNTWVMFKVLVLHLSMVL